MGSLRYHARWFVALFALLLPFQSATAETVEAKLPTGIIATADFRAGQPARPAVLLLHGFLQTHHAPPTSSLANTLANQGYTVLTPTLSLGINQRSQSLACEAVHAHTMDGDVAEIGFWVDWLTHKGYNSIALIGHSAGSSQILQYLAQKPSPAVRKAILTSLTAFHSENAERQTAVERMKTLLPADEKDLGRFTLTYCIKNYVAPPRAFLSYAAYDADKTLKLLGKTRALVEVVMGGTDTTMNADWIGKIRRCGVPVTVIEKTGHFFDGEQELDLADKTESVLKALPVMR